MVRAIGSISSDAATLSWSYSAAGTNEAKIATLRGLSNWRKKFEEDEMTRDTSRWDAIRLQAAGEKVNSLGGDGEAEAEGFQDSGDRCELRVAFWRQRLVEIGAAEAGGLGNLGHALRAGDVAKRRFQ
jgi:hypothetical protein